MTGKLQICGVEVRCPKNGCVGMIPSPNTGSHIWASADVVGVSPYTTLGGRCETCGSWVQVPKKLRTLLGL